MARRPRHYDNSDHRICQFVFPENDINCLFLNIFVDAYNTACNIAVDNQQVLTIKTEKI